MVEITVLTVCDICAPEVTVKLALFVLSGNELF
jgi:hypothetical protein